MHRLLLVTAAIMVVASPRAMAQADAAVDRAATQIYESVMSPFCPGLLLSNCPSPQAEDLREWIRTRLEAGAQRAEILDQIESAYGEGIRAIPRPRGVALLAWLVPGGSIVLGGVGLWWWLRRASRRTRAAPVATPLDHADQERVERELAAL